MVLKECLFIKNSCYIKNQKMTGGKPTGIVVHSTGANNKTLKRYVQPVPSQSYYSEVLADIGTNAYNNHWNMSSAEMGRSVCVHAFIGVNAAGKIETYQVLPYDVCCWGVGAIPYDKNGKELPSGNHPDFDHYGPSYNYNPQARVQYEICEDGLTDAAYFNAAMKEAQEYCAYLCKKFGLGIDKISSHRESHDAGYGCNHGDPDHWLKKFGKNMNWFRAEVQKLLDADKAPEKPQEPKPTGVLYRVQTGAFSNKANADKLAAELKSKGFDTYIVLVGTLYKVQVGAYSVKANAEAMAAKLKAAGYDNFITTNTGNAATGSTQPTEAFSVGDKVKCNAGVKTFSNGQKMASWVPTALLYVRKVENGGRVLLVSTEPTKAVYTGRVNAADVHKI